MSLPEDRLAETPVPADLLSPDDLGRPTPTVDYERGGIALNDPTQGRNYQNWRVRVVNGEVRVVHEPYSATETVLFADAAISQVSIAFDQNMRPTVAFVAAGQAKLYWWDTLLSTQVTVDLDADVRTPFVTLDDKRDGAMARSDILLFYIRGSKLYYRQQRDRYTVERELWTLPSGEFFIKRCGMNRVLRVQIELETRL